MENSKSFWTGISLNRFLICCVAVLIAFSALSKGAHDVWAATLVYLCVLTLIVALIVSVPNPSWPHIRIPLLFPIASVVLTLFISFYGSNNPGESFLEYMDWLALVGVFIVSVNIFRSQEDVRILIALLVPVFLVEWGVMLSQFLHIIFMSPNIDYREPTGTFVNGNSAIAFTLLWFPSILEQAVHPSTPGRLPRWYWVTGAAAMTLVFLLVFSTWSVICLFFGFLVYLGKSRLFTFYRTHRRLLLLFFGLCALISLFLIWNKLALLYGWGGIAPKRYAPTSRLIWWEGGLQMWRDHPWFGVGIGNFPSTYLAYKAGPGFNTLYAHSFVIQLLAESGVCGLFAVLLFISSALVLARKYLFGHLRALTTGVAMFLLFSSIHVSFEYLSHLLALGLLLGILSVPRGEERSKWIPNFSIKVIVVGLALIALPTIVSPFFASRLWVDGVADLKEKNLDSAETKFKAAIAIDPRTWEPHMGLAHVAASRGDFVDAVKFAEEALKKNKLDPNIKRDLENFRLKTRAPGAAEGTPIQSPNKR